MDNLGHDKIGQWSADTWSAIDKAVLDEHKLTAVAAKFLTPPVLDTTNNGTVQADTVLTGSDGVLFVSEADTIPIIEISAQFRVRRSQVEKEDQWKTAQSNAIKAANNLARGEDLLIFQGREALKAPLFKSKTVVLRTPDPADPNARIDGFLFKNNPQTIQVEPAEVNAQPVLSIYGENTYAAVAQGYATLQETHYGRQALVLPSTIFADTYATRTTTLDIPAITADRLKGLLETRIYGTSSLPSVGNAPKSPPAKGVLLALDGNTMDLVVQMGPTVEVVTQDAASGDYVFRVYERFALRLKDRKAVVELDFSSEGGIDE